MKTTCLLLLLHSEVEAGAGVVAVVGVVLVVQEAEVST